MIAEVAALRRAGSIVRIPPADDVPFTPRVRRVVDSAPMRRLASISQLGMVSRVYPGAVHSRLEHSMGVYHNALQLLSRFTGDEAFQSTVDSSMADAFVLAALVHDVGHWPFCHPIEDLQLKGLGQHESRVETWLNHDELAKCIDQDWQCDGEHVLRLLDPGRAKQMPAEQQCDGLTDAQRLLISCLSGPIDIDKLDYLQRDSLHAGVPYGRNFDVGRLINSMCVHPDRWQLAVGEKGRTAAEMMVFSRYVMFSEVYWHHAVRSATAMLQRAVFFLQQQIDWETSLRLTETPWMEMLQSLASGSNVEPIVEGLFGGHRRLYKRVAEFNVVDGGGVHRRLARRPYWWLVACSERLTERVSKLLGREIDDTKILIDAPPVKLEVDINIDVVRRDGRVDALGDVSPVAAVLARQQFDDQVKRVRVYADPDLRADLDSCLKNMDDWGEHLIGAADALEDDLA